VCESKEVLKARDWKYSKEVNSILPLGSLSRRLANKTCQKILFCVPGTRDVLGLNQRKCFCNFDFKYFMLLLSSYCGRIFEKACATCVRARLFERVPDV
jgi:hypothetical protein